MNLADGFREILAELRSRLSGEGVNQAEVSRQSGVPAPVLWRFVKGERGINAETAQKLLDALGIVVVVTIKKGKPKT